jgi:hypothetical protein
MKIDPQQNIDIQNLLKDCEKIQNKRALEF